jgi:hypothetical protein
VTADSEQAMVSPSGDIKWKPVHDGAQVREVEPTLTMLRMVLMDAPSNDDELHTQARMRQMHELIEFLTESAASGQTDRPILR